MPDNPIFQARRERGWSQLQLMQQMRARATSAGVTLPDDDVLRVRVSSWENGHHRPSPIYQQLLVEALEMVPSDLGFSGRTEPPVLRLTADAVSYLDTTFHLHTKADQRLGSRMLLSVVREQTRQAETWTRQSRGSIREALLRRTSKYAEFCGWLHQDQGDFATADDWTRKAIEMSQELGDTDLVAYALMRRSNIATESGRPADGLHLAEAALRQRSGADPRLIALSMRQKAAAHALLGEAHDTETAVERGTEAAKLGRDSNHPESAYCTVPYIVMEGGNSLLIAGQADRAAELLEQALIEWPEGQHRDHGLCLARLANAYARLGDLGAACVTAHRAIDTLAEAPSARTEGSLRHLRGRLMSQRRQIDVSELRERLAQAV